MITTSVPDPNEDTTMYSAPLDQPVKDFLEEEHGIIPATGNLFNPYNLIGFTWPKSTLSVCNCHFYPS